LSRKITQNKQGLLKNIPFGTDGNEKDLYLCSLKKQVIHLLSIHSITNK